MSFDAERSLLFSGDEQADGEKQQEQSGEF